MIDFDAALAPLRGKAGLVAIDGLPVSGKSTLAERFARELSAVTIYLDDFVRPQNEWRGVVAPAFPFPYIRYDAFLATVTTLARGETAQYQLYDWSSGQLADWRTVSPNGLTVIEGVSSLHPDLAPLYDVRFWIESDAKTTLEASLARGVGDLEHEWRALFMPSVALYLETNPRRRADHIVGGRGATGPAQG